MKDTAAAGNEAQNAMDDAIFDKKRLSDGDRLQALDRTGIMDAPPPTSHQRAARLAGRLLKVPVCLVSFVDDKRQYFSAQTGLDAPLSETRMTPLSHSLCQHVVTSEETLVVDDTRKNPMVCGNGAVQDMNVIAYLGAPIRSPEGYVLGSFCAIDTKPRKWSEDDIAHMRDFAAMIESDLRLRETLEERDIVLQEMNHRVKNLFTIVNSILRMERRAHDTAEELAESVGNRLKALSDAQQMIVPVIHARQSEGATTTLDALTRKLLSPHGGDHDTRILIRGDHVPVGPKAAVYLALALHELATNAAKYGGLSQDGGKLLVEWSRSEGDVVVMTWEETGLAWDRQSPKRSGFGSRLLSIAVEGQLAGEIETEIATDRFTRTLRMPAARLQH
ncbi:HWE histidine kinase domain-containing protein [Antarctobacter jejuensis]|uniref:HWE histidine kinase domain-containing protein n=1 Tax=Antarctobacter jejuensis TaxID=1439938 RepID=UPI003FD3A1DE